MASCCGRKAILCPLLFSINGEVSRVRTQRELFVEGNDRYYVSELLLISATNVLRVDGDEPFGVYGENSGLGSCVVLYSGGRCRDQPANVRPL